MSKEKISVSKVASIIDLEGFGYAITDAIAAESIEDNVLSTMWADAVSKMKEIEQYIFSKLNVTCWEDLWTDDGELESFDTLEKTEEAVDFKLVLDDDNED